MAEWVMQTSQPGEFDEHDDAGVPVDEAGSTEHPIDEAGAGEQPGVDDSWAHADADADADTVAWLDDEPPAGWSALDRARRHAWQRPVMLIVGLAVAAFAGLVVYAVGRAGNALDTWMYESSPGVSDWALARIMLALRMMGNLQLVGPVAVVAFVATVTRPRLRRASLYAAVVFGLGVAVGTALKFGLGQPGPPEYGVPQTHGSAFPSGHTLVATLFYGVVAAFIAAHVNRRWLPVLVAGWEFAALTVGSCQVLLQVHWLSDVLAAWLYSVAWMGLAALVLDAYERRRRAQ